MGRVVSGDQRVVGCDRHRVAARRSYRRICAERSVHVAGRTGLPVRDFTRDEVFRAGYGIDGRIFAVDLVDVDFGKGFAPAARKADGQPQVAGFDMSVECGVHSGAARHVFARYGSSGLREVLAVGAVFDRHRGHGAVSQTESGHQLLLLHVDIEHVAVLFRKIDRSRSAAVEQIGIIAAVGRPRAAARGGEADHVVGGFDGADEVDLGRYGHIDRSHDFAGVDALGLDAQRRQVVAFGQQREVARERHLDRVGRCRRVFRHGQRRVFERQVLGGQRRIRGLVLGIVALDQRSVVDEGRLDARMARGVAADGEFGEEFAGRAGGLVYDPDRVEVFRAGLDVNQSRSAVDGLVEVFELLTRRERRERRCGREYVFRDIFHGSGSVSGYFVTAGFCS